MRYHIDRVLLSSSNALIPVVGALFVAIAGCSYDFDIFDGPASGGAGGSPAGGNAAGAAMNVGGAPNGPTTTTTTNNSVSTAVTSTGGNDCGNGTLEAGEECDDGDDDDEDGCAGCQVLCVEPYFQDSVSGHCYWIRNEDAIWSDARARCQLWQPGAHLAVITTSEEDDLLRARVNPEDFDLAMNGTFFGAGDLTQTNDWAWVNGEPWSYDDWSAGQPNNFLGGKDEDCAAYINLGGGVGWYDAPCALMLSSVCEWAP